MIFGWAWRPGQPDEPVEIEVLVDGILVGATVASEYRPDLRAVGIGHGRYGWSLDLDLDLDREAPFNVLARVRDGEPLQSGVFEHSVSPPAGDYERAEFQAFMASVFNPADAPAPPPPPEPERSIVNFLLYCPVQVGSATLGSAEYSYGFVLKAFRPVLERLGRVHVIEDPAREADDLYTEQLARGESSLLLSFAPPHRAPLGLRCPVTPVIAWEYPTIPDRVWGGELRNDWRFVLRQTGRAITLSRFAADAVRAGMGPGFPVAAIPAPVWDRYPDLHGLGAPVPGAEVRIEGFVFDTTGRTFPIAEATPPSPKQDPDRPVDAWTASGIVFTSVFAPKDGRKNWLQIITAFITAHRQRRDVTLVLKIVGADTAYWWWEFYDALQRQRAFECRIVVLHGYMDEANYNGLVAASHWVVNASLAEGLCLPLLEFMSAGRPAIAPQHTAMADYIDASDALIVESDEEFCSWPHDPDITLTTTRHRITWSSLVSAFEEAYRLTTVEPERYSAMAASAASRMRRFCGDELVARDLDAFLSLGQGKGRVAASPSSLMRDVAG